MLKIVKCYVEKITEEKAENNGEGITAVWQNGGFSAKLNIWFSNEHLC